MEIRIGSDRVSTLIAIDHSQWAIMTCLPYMATCVRNAPSWLQTAIVNDMRRNLIELIDHRLPLIRTIFQGQNQEPGMPPLAAMSDMVITKT